MQADVDQIWCTPSGIGMRIAVWGDQNQWRQKRYTVVKWEDIPSEVITDIIGTYLDQEPEEDYHQTALF
jgi:hypothetical protein